MEEQELGDRGATRRRFFAGLATLGASGTAVSAIASGASTASGLDDDTGWMSAEVVGVHPPGRLSVILREPAGEAVDVNVTPATRVQRTEGNAAVADFAEGDVIAVKGPRNGAAIDALALQLFCHVVAGLDVQSRSGHRLIAGGWRLDLESDAYKLVEYGRGGEEVASKEPSEIAAGDTVTVLGRPIRGRFSVRAIRTDE